MTIPIPAIIVGGAALMIMGSGKKSRKRSGHNEKIEGDNFDNAVDESMLDEYSEPTGEEAGDFKTKEEDISISDDEEESIDTDIEGIDYHNSDDGTFDNTDKSALCDEFLSAAHIQYTEQGEIPINKVALEQTVVPAMTAVINNYDGSIVDADHVGPEMILAALSELVPVCDWEYNEEDYEFTYSGGSKITSDAGKDVLYGLFSISSQIIDDFNKSILGEG